MYWRHKYLKDKKYLIIFLLIILVSFSGCLNFITTREKQVCLALTHFSSTSIEDCFSQNSCFKDVDKLGFYTSPELPNELYGDLLKYKNNIASAYYYYSLNKKEIQEINDGCKNNNYKKIITVKVSAFNNLRQTIKHIDQATEQSVYLLEGYAYYLQEQEIELIAEEDLFDDYVLLNNNLNFLTTEEDNGTYSSKVNEEVKGLHTEIKKLGYDETYMAETNMPDLFSYYTKIYSEGLEGAVTYIPSLYDFSQYALNSLSVIDDLNSINDNFYTLKVHNFYQVINSFVGSSNSLLSDFKSINNSYNENLDKVYLKIADVEKNIEDNNSYLETKDFAHYNKLKKEFKFKEITFGYYLSEINKINAKVMENRIDNIKRTQKYALDLLACDGLVDAVRQYTSIYFKEKINSYKISENVLEKLKICADINKGLTQENCIQKINLFLETDAVEKEEFELFYYKEDKSCVEILSNINYKLENNFKIQSFKKQLQDVSVKISEIEQHKINYQLQKIIIESKEKIHRYKNEDNITLFINIDKKNSELITMDNQINEIYKFLINDEMFYSVIYLKDKYFLKIHNPFSKSVNNFILDTHYYGITSKDGKVNVQGNKITVKSAHPGDNFYQVAYANKTEIDYKITYLSLDESVIKITIKNQVEGIVESIDFIDGFSTRTKDVHINKNKIFFTTEKENQIIVTGSLFEKESTKEIFELTPLKFITSEKIKITNKYVQPINQKIIFKPIDETSIVRLMEENKEIETNIENNKITFTLLLAKDSTKEYSLQTISEKEEIYSEIKKLVLEISKFNNCVFQDIKNTSNTKLSKIATIPYKEKYSVSEITSFYLLLPEIEKLRQKLNLAEKTEIEYFIKYQEISVKELTIKEKNTLTRIDSNKYKDIVAAEKELSELLKIILEREESEKDKMQIENKIYFQTLKEKVITYGLDGINLDLLIKDNDVNKINQIINAGLKKKAEEIYYLISPATNNLDSKNMTYLVNKTYKLYEDHDLSELYSVNYFAGITKYDAERLEKNLSFLDSVLFNREISSFEEKFDSQEYEKAINTISLETINRVNKVKADVSTLEKGIEVIRNDAKEEILSYQKKEYDAEILTLAKKYYEEEKYLNTILLIRKNSISEKQTLKGKQIIIFSLIIVLFSATYAYFRLGNKKKEESHKDKKKKILRH